MSSVAKVQELPPSGGFSKIHYERVPHKTYFNGKRIALLVGAITVMGSYLYGEAYKLVKSMRRETQSAKNAIQPFLLAERDRIMLRQMRKNRERETQLMQDVPGWEVGTLYGIPMYFTAGENEWTGYHRNEYYVNVDPNLEFDHARYAQYNI